MVWGKNGALQTFEMWQSGNRDDKSMWKIHWQIVIVILENLQQKQRLLRRINDFAIQNFDTRWWKIQKN